MKVTRYLASAFFFLGACFFAFLIMATVIRGEPTALTVRLGKPKACVAATVLLLGAAYILWKGPGGVGRGWRVELGRFLMAAVILGAGAVMAELYLRSYCRATQGINPLRKLKEKYNPGPIYREGVTPLADIVQLSTNLMLTYELKPNLDKEFGHHALRTNSRGMRGSREFTLEKPPGVTRVLGVGDSGMFGWNTQEGENYLAVLSRELNRRENEERVEVLNMAVPGYNTQQEIELLASRGTAYSPDVVIVGWNANDFDMPFFLARHDNHDKWNKSYLYTFVFFRREFVDKIATPQVMKASEIDRRFVDPAVLDGLGPEGVERALLRLRRLAEEFSFKPLLFGPMGRDIRAICARVGVDYCNTLEEIAPSVATDKTGLHHMHPRPEAHAMLGRLLAGHLRQRGWIE